MAAYYLVRTGSTALLDVEIEMRPSFGDRAEIFPTDWASQVGYMSGLLEFLKTHGATPERWRTLSILAGQPEPLFEVIAFLHKQVSPALRCLSLKWASKNIQHSEESRALSGAETLLRSLVLSDQSVPKLRHVELTSVPWPFVLDRSSPLFTGLTSLSLTAATRLGSISKLADLLRGNPLLESLQLSSGPNSLNNVYFSDYPLPRVILPSLRSLSVQSTYHGDWILDVLKATQTPNLETFTLATELYIDYPGGATVPELMLLSYLSDGSLKEDGDNNGSGSGSETRSLYPLLQELDVSLTACHSGGQTIVTLLSSFASVTRLSIASHQIDCLGKFPWVLPKLQTLKSNGYPNPDLGIMLRRRAAAGHPIQTVELRGDLEWDQETRDAYISALPEEVKIVECPGPQNITDDGSDIGHWDDQVDDEDVGGYYDSGDEPMEGVELDLGEDDLENEGREEYSDQEEYVDQADYADYADYGEYADHEAYEEAEQEHDQSDVYGETTEYSEGIYLPACWVDEETGVAYMYDLGESADDGEWAHGYSTPFVGDNYFEGEHTYDDGGYYEGNEWGGYDAEESDGDGGSDLEGVLSDYGDFDDDHGDNYDDDYDDYDVD
ncbi:unnamed protein product [Rhizoctonia solani]|uniref:Uncharacterized protein n=1 Tax=Rhizoctonia solani TaxID=456999 RepID=A0A8H3DUV1_9AGAM|nr:unnamed protein product [Rhizoctonia solani]